MRDKKNRRKSKRRREKEGIENVITRDSNNETEVIIR